MTSQDQLALRIEEEQRERLMPPVLSDLGLVTKGTRAAWAVTSPDDRYRYVLGRFWADFLEDDEKPWWDRDIQRPLWVFCMLNPSDARHDIPDPTIRKCTGFARRGGAGGFIVVNLLAYSTPYPKELVAAHRLGVNVCGDHNDAAIRWATSSGLLMRKNVAAWGRVPPRLRSLVQGSISRFMMAQPHCLGTNQDGSPLHPLMPSYDGHPLVEYKR